MTRALARGTRGLLWIIGLSGSARIVVRELIAGQLLHIRGGRLGWAAAALAAAAGVVLLLPRFRERWDIVAEPPADSAAGRHALELLLAAAQMALVTLLLRTFCLEHESLRQYVAPLVLFGFLVHQGLTARLKLPAFVALSMIVFLLVLGPRGGASLVGVGLLVIGVCRLPVPFPARAAVVGAAGLALAFARAGVLPSPVPEAVWPVVGSFFMFRTACYLYDLKHGKVPAGPWPTLAYFFLLPNVSFLLFPIVDLQALRRGFQSRSATGVYLKGLRYLLRGVVYLVLYRYVYRNLAIPASEVSGSGDLFRYLLSNYLLLLQVLGQFDLAVGILHLFGFDLPDPNDLNLFAPSFTEFWRRTNTYWRDFVMKLAYHPAYFALRSETRRSPVLLATAIAFGATALLHSYQWFWLRGFARFTTTDAAFWGAFGALLLVNVALEARRPHRVAPRGQGLTVGERLALAAKGAAMFAIVSVFWSLWSARSVGDWVTLMRFAATPPGKDFSWTLGLGVVLLLYWTVFRLSRGPAAGSSPGRALGHAVGVTAVMGALAVAGRPGVYARLGTGVAEVARGLKQSGFNRADDQEVVRSYYENLAHANVANPALWKVLQLETKGEKDWVQHMGTPVADLRRVELKPGSRFDRSTTGRHLGDALLACNRWGFRDRDYELAKPPGAFRAVFLGGSYVFDPNVSNDETFEQVLEDRLNLENDHRTYERYELLNFGIGRYGPLESLVRLEKKAVTFQPDVVLYVSVEGELRRAVEALIHGVAEGLELDYQELRDLSTRARLDASVPQEEMARRLLPHRERLLRFVYDRMVRVCRERKAVPVWVRLPPIEMAWSGEETATASRIAQEAGFLILPLDDAYAGFDVATLRVAPTNHHPNVLGCRVIADALHRALQGRGSEIPFALPVRKER